MEKLRDDIDQDPHRLKRALMSEGLRRDFFDGAKDEKAVINKFIGMKMNAESALKTKPKVGHLLWFQYFSMRHLWKKTLTTANRATKPTTKTSNCSASRTSRLVGSSRILTLPARIAWSESLVSSAPWSHL
jgi:hypothetical protein